MRPQLAKSLWIQGYKCPWCHRGFPSTAGVETGAHQEPALATGPRWEFKNEGHVVNRCMDFVDVGGDDGAVVLGRYREHIAGAGYAMLYVISMYRPLTADPMEAAALMREIEEASGLRCTAVVNNSSIGAETTAEDILASVEWAHAAADACGLPLAFHAYYESLNPDLPEVFAAAGYGREMLLPMENVTRKLF